MSYIDREEEKCTVVHAGEHSSISFFFTGELISKNAT